MSTSHDEASEDAPTIDTSKMSEGQRAALELTEAARGPFQHAGPAQNLFMGNLDLRGIRPYPIQSPEERAAGETFLQELAAYLRDHVDADEIDRTGEIPDEVIAGLAKLGAFGIKIPKQYGGLGLSQTHYCRAAMLLGSHCGNTTALISAHQSIGVPQPLLMFGTEAQKKKFLPRVAKGEISAFALTEVLVGSDPARMETHADPTPEGDAFVLNGEKLWCTNGVKAGVIVVMARTPPTAKRKNAITAFLVEMDTPGVEVVHRCHFMGLHALYNGVIRFHDVRVPCENILLEEGKGLKVALSTLNTGRLTLPAACVGLSKRCLAVSRTWAAEREQWGCVIGKHAAIADKLARMAANTLAMESMTLLAAALVDRDHERDHRVESAMCKMWATETAWDIINDAIQIRGGRGYETADSLRTRGDAVVPLERFLRDTRINTIFEGSSEIMRLFIAREALDPHLKLGAPALNTTLSRNQRLRAAGNASKFYAGWYPLQWLSLFPRVPGDMPAAPRRHLRRVARDSHHLARAMFHAMARHGPALEKQQILLARFVEIGTELFATTAVCLRWEESLKSPNSETGDISKVADLFCRQSRQRVQARFHSIRHNTDNQAYALAKGMLDGDHRHLEEGIC